VNLKGRSIEPDRGYHDRDEGGPVGGQDAAAPVYLEDGEPEYLRLSRARMLASAVGFPALYLWGGLSPAHFGWVNAVSFFLLVMGAMGLYRIAASDGLELHRGYLVLRRGWFSKATAACDVEDVRIERRPGWWNRKLVIVLTNGRRYRVYEPGRGAGLLRNDFDRDLQRVRDWWLANRELDVVVVRVDRVKQAA
jgi:hypothetical protein